jgi:hypothetical protein
VFLLQDSHYLIRLRGRDLGVTTLSSPFLSSDLGEILLDPLKALHHFLHAITHFRRLWQPKA